MFVKICGTTSEEDALLSVALGADALGFIFAPSPRQVAASVVHDIIRRLPPEILTIGVFRNELPQRVAKIVNDCGLRGAQLHGRETPDQSQWLKERIPVVIKAFVGGDPAIKNAEGYGADAVLLDSPNPGSGKVFDWRLAEDAPTGVPILLAGGLTADNIADAIEKVHPFGVDSCTGVEREPGKKDPRKLRLFIANAKATEPDDEERVDEVFGPAPYDWNISE
ncbi:MAG: phosphoribosylanthranilate isomerase [Actinomycetota bacterium]|nr:phosphoribosylanthranilate isomerase [Actinomycetota bacterium]